MKNEEPKLCVNVDCERYQPDWDFEENTEENYEEGQWKKCCLCDGYFDDDGFGDILYVQEEPNNQESECDLCGKTENIVQMKGSGQFLCESACDEEDNDRFVKCDECSISVDCYKNSIHIVYKGELGIMTDEKTMCTMCFHEQEDDLIEAGFNCDDWSIEEDNDD